MTLKTAPVAGAKLARWPWNTWFDYCADGAELDAKTAQASFAKVDIDETCRDVPHNAQ
jgi:hypothetical protein